MDGSAPLLGATVRCVSSLAGFGDPLLSWVAWRRCRRRRRRRRRRCRITIGLGWDDQRSFVRGAEMSVPMRVCSFRGGLLWGIV